MKSFPVGGSRQAVYGFLQGKGFVMSRWSDKHWERADGVQLNLYGAGSQARISDKGGNLLADGPLSEAVASV